MMQLNFVLKDNLLIFKNYLVILYLYSIRYSDIGYKYITVSQV